MNTRRHANPYLDTHVEPTRWDVAGTVVMMGLCALISFGALDGILTAGVQSSLHHTEQSR